MGRLLLTLVCICVVVGLQYIPLPGIDHRGLQAYLGVEAPLMVGIIGLKPVIFAFVAVEFAALVVPRWRTLRTGGKSTRAVLSRWSLVLAVLVAAGEGSFVVYWVQSQAGPDPGFLTNGPLVAISVVGGAVALVVVADLAGRRGLGSGFSVVIFALAGVQLWESAASLAWAGPGLLAAAGVAVATRLIFRHPRTTVVAPTAGIVPAIGALWFLGMIAAAEPFAANPAANPVSPESTAYLVTGLTLVVGLSFLVSWLFHLPSRVGRPLPALGRAKLWSTGFVLVVAAAGLWVASAGVMVPVVAIALAVAIAHDLAAEWRFRREHGSLVTLDELHRCYVVPLAEATLRTAGIPVLARGLRHRSLWHFFAPYIPVEVMVPETRLTDALAVVDSE